MMKFLGPSFVLASAALLAGCAGDGEQPEQQSASGFTAAPQTLTTKTTALPIQSEFNIMRSTVDAERDIAFVGAAFGTKVSALRLATRQHLWQLTLDGNVDQLFFDTEGRRLYISTASTLYVVEPMTGAVLHSVALSSPVVAITYLPAKTASAQGQLIIGQRANSSEWLLSALNPDTLAAVASTTLPAIIDDSPKLQITAGAGLIWTMNYQGQRLYTIRPYLLMGDAIYPIDDHQVVDSLRDTGLMISPNGEWLVTGGNNVLQTSLGGVEMEYFHPNSHGFDHFASTVSGGGVFWGDTFGLMVRDTLAGDGPAVERVRNLTGFRPSQVLSTVSGIYVLGNDQELGLAMQFVMSNRTSNPVETRPFNFSPNQVFIPFDGTDSHKQEELYLRAVIGAGEGPATMRPVCYEPCTFTHSVEIPLLEGSHQVNVNINSLTDGAIAGVIVDNAARIEVNSARWLYEEPSACQASQIGNQLTGDVDVTSLDLFLTGSGSSIPRCDEADRVYRLEIEREASGELQIGLGALACETTFILASESGAASTDDVNSVKDFIGGGDLPPNSLTGVITTAPLVYIDSFTEPNPSKSTCF